MALLRREALALAGVALAAAAAGFVIGPRVLQRESGEAAAIAAARFQDLAGATRGLAQWNGRILLLNFWATWCAPCREEIPMLMELRSEYLQFGVEVVGIAIDMAPKVSDYVKQMQIDYPILVADAGGLDLMRKLGNTAGGLPYTVLVDRQGNPVRRKLGALRRDELLAMLKPLVARPST
ncbi:MAG: TlpA family protein disulfide reductase [Betaproteobacteria bacterium]|nr:MAG: TlpA family protein disulfide reductase [Betaproteobacteria bacterium]